jgi:hypothetical protein
VRQLFLGVIIVFATACGLLISLGIVLGYFLLGAGTARAQDGHAQHHDVYKGWLIPDANFPTSCCNEKKDGSGDCYPTTAELRMSANPAIKHRVWWARRDTGQWIEVPDRKILNGEINPDPTGAGAHICESAGIVHCFREPVGGT